MVILKNIYFDLIQQIDIYIYHCLEALNDSVRQYFSKYQYTILQNQAWLKDSLKVQERPTDQSMKNSDMLLGSTLQITFNKL